jgi:hypothetical protein
MRLEFWLLIITAFVLGNLYYEGQWMRKVTAHQKYLKMAGVLVAAYSAYWLFRGNPNRQTAAQLASSALRDLDADASAQFSPLLDRIVAVGASERRQPETQFDSSGLRDGPAHPGALAGARTHKRSVSEARKKLVASRQKWHCHRCQQMLAASYEIDHIIRLDRGGDNSVQNLVALCRNCHGEKTSMELM